MTVSSENLRISYTGAGSTGPFAFPYYFLENDDLKVIKRTKATGAEVTLVLTTDYTVAGAGVPAGGTITTVVAVSADYEIVIFRDPDALQLVDYIANDPFPAETHEKALDKLTMLVQRVKDLMLRSLHLTDGDTSGASMTLPVDRASKYLAFDASGVPIASLGTSALPVVSAFMETVLDDANAAAARATLGVFQPKFKLGLIAFDLSNVNGYTQAIVGVGFTPRLVKFCGDIDGTTVASIHGHDDGTTKRCMYADQTGAGKMAVSSAASIVLVVTAGVDQQAGHVTAFGADGFTITWAKTGAPVGVANILYEAYD